MTKPKPKAAAVPVKATAKPAIKTSAKPLRATQVPKASVTVAGTSPAAVSPCLPASLPDAVFTHLDKVLEQCQIRMDVPGFEPLANVLQRAYDQAAMGKGVERHGQGQPFTQQPMQQHIALHGLGFATGQASKKAGEAQRMLTRSGDVAPAVRELLGAIVYLAGAVVALELDAAREVPFVRA